MQMHQAGRPLSEIRAAIEAHYKIKYRFMTPTPHPPRGTANTP
jgi:hypothetical protein